MDHTKGWWSLVTAPTLFSSSLVDQGERLTSLFVSPGKFDNERPLRHAAINVGGRTPLEVKKGFDWQCEGSKQKLVRQNYQLTVATRESRLVRYRQPNLRLSERFVVGVPCGV